MEKIGSAGPEAEGYITAEDNEPQTKNISSTGKPAEDTKPKQISKQNYQNILNQIDILKKSYLPFHMTSNMELPKMEYDFKR